MSVGAFTSRLVLRRAGRGSQRARFDGLGLSGVASLSIVALALLISVIGPWIAPDDPLTPSLGLGWVGPSSAHLLGYDGQGRDVLSCLLAATRISVLVPVGIVAVSTVLGAGLGIASAWVGGRFDRIVSATCNVLFAFPAILLAMVAAAFFGLGVRAVSIALTIAYLPMLARLIRASALRESSLPYVVALRLQGLSAVRICARHLVPNLMSIIVAQASIAFAWAMIDLSAVSFLGLGVQPPNQDWGAMLNQGAEGMLQGYPLEAIVVCAAFVIVVCAVTVLSDRLLTRADAGA